MFRRVFGYVLAATAGSALTLVYLALGDSAGQSSSAGIPAASSPRPISVDTAGDTGVQPKAAQGKPAAGNKSRLVVNTLDAVFALIPEQQVVHGLATLMRYTDQDLQRIDDPATYARSLADAALGLDDNQGTPASRSLKFGPSPTSAFAEGQAFFEADSGTLYAVFDSADIQSPHVIVRWMHVETGQVLVFGKQLIVPFRPSNHVWFKQAPWKEGSYRVDVFAETEQLTPIASGEFVIYL